MKGEIASNKLRKWFFLNRRFLPWRENPSPYEVWVSEVMLQQTQVKVVIPYFQNWIKAFPTVHKLSQAPLENVIKAWEGLGYYSRARNLHEGAKYIVKEHNGELPKTYEELKKVKGLGSYTIGAILSFAFKQKAAAVDANVIRVVSRFFFIEEEIEKKSTQDKIKNLTDSFLPDFEPWIIMEALIELGALVCKKTPTCLICPLKESCVSHKKKCVEKVPLKRKPVKKINLQRHVAIIYSGKKILIRKREKGKVMADLWEFPYFEIGKDYKKVFDFPLKLIKKLPKVSHGFTKFKACLYPHLYFLEEQEIEHYSWISKESIQDKPFSSGHRRILGLLKEENIL